MKGGRSYNLGVLFSDDSQSGLTHPFFSGVLESFKKEAEAAGYDITFISHRMGAGRVTYLDHCRYREVDGICVACIDFQDEEVLHLIQSDIPLVTIDCIFEDRPWVCSDNADGIRQLLEYIFTQGHRRIAYIHGPHSAVTDVRLAAFHEKAEQLGLHFPPGYIDECEYTNPASAYEAAKRILALPQRPTCILICDDFSSTGVMRAAREAGLRVPEDISLAGYDGVDYIQMLSPRLTTIYQDGPRIGREAAQALIALVETANAQCRSVPCTLIRGETIQPLKGTA